MNSLFRNVLLRSKDSLLKESLQSQLVSCVKDIQLDHAHSGRFQSSSEAAEALCTVLEAIFIHGIKESFADKMAIAMGDPDTRPEPNFWPALLVFSHRDLIHQIGKLNFISSDIGRCRAWLRMALNDNLLTSYLQSMLAQNSALNSFYKRSAYLRDNDLVDMSITLVSGVEAYSFCLACNSSLLNTWTNQPLLMAGVWSPAMKSCPITSGTDIAQSLNYEDFASRAAEDSVSSVVSVASLYESSLSSNAFDEDEALKIILGTDVTHSHDQKEYLKVMENSNAEVNTNLKSDNQRDHNLKTNVAELEATGKTTDETAIDVGLSSGQNSNNVVQIEQTPIVVEKELEQHRKLQSYHSLVESYNQTSTNVTKMPDLQDLLQKFQMPSNPPKSISNMSPSTDSDSEMVEKLDFEIVSENCDPSNLPEFSILLQHINRIATEQGLDSQNFLCRTCPQPVGINFVTKVCGLTGAYYCSDCFGANSSNEYWVIPARIIYNWDFRRYSVSPRAADFLSQIQLYPLFDIMAINPKIYNAVEEMARIKVLRIQLNFLRAYLATCRGNAIEALQKQIWPREYLFEKLHHYSLADLLQVPSGALQAVLQSAVSLSRTHIFSCSLCSQKGFICEKCKNPKVIYPFEVDETYRCNDCFAVYHSECLQPGQLCPKCKRIQERQILSLPPSPPPSPTP